MENDTKEFRLRKIRNGTVLNHLTAGTAMRAYQILKLPKTHQDVVSVIMNVDSKKLGKKDMLKIENIYLTETQTATIALFAPQATVNIIENEQVIKKFNVELPNEITGVIDCQNANCITKYERDLQCTAIVKNKQPLQLQCQYCENQIQPQTI